MIGAHAQAVIVISLITLAVAVVAVTGACIVATMLPAKPRPKVVTEYWAKPIPFRGADWLAFYAGDEPDDDGHMDCGQGATDAEARADLLTNYPRDEPRPAWLEYFMGQQPREASSILTALALAAFIVALALLLPQP